MEQYIPKSAAIAEIKKLKAKFDNYLCMAACDAIEESINTIEVKEVGLDLEDPYGDTGVKILWDKDKIVISKVQKGE